jgi:hypothetical protein
MPSEVEKRFIDGIDFLFVRREVAGDFQNMASLHLATGKSSGLR